MFICANPELQFLINFIKPEVNSAGSLNLSQLDWHRVMDLAVHHRLIPLICRHLPAISNAGAPPEILALFQQKNIANSTRNAFLSKELLKILGMFKQAGILVLPFKGPTLAIDAYGDISLRQFDDLDLIMKKDDVLRAASLMTANGYKPLLDMPEETRRKHINADWGFSLTSPEADYHLELISNAAPDLYSFHLPFEDILSHPNSLVLDSNTIQALSPECNLVLLCVHGSKHIWERLAWIADITYLLHSKQNINWQTVLDLAEKSGSKRMLLMSLHMANTFTDSPLPPDVLRMIADDAHISSLTARVIETYHSTTEPQFSAKDEVMFLIQSRERLSDRLRYIFHLIFFPGYSDWQVMQLPSFLSPLYFITRPFRLLFRFLSRRKLSSCAPH